MACLPTPLRLPAGCLTPQEAQAKKQYEAELLELTSWKAQQLAGSEYVLDKSTYILNRLRPRNRPAPQGNSMDVKVCQKIIAERYSIPAETLQAWREEFNAWKAPRLVEEERANEQKKAQQAAEEQRVATLFAAIIAPPK